MGIRCLPFKRARSVILVPMMRIERMTSPLPRECSTTELHRRNRFRSVAVDPDPPSDANRGAGEGNRTLVISLEGFCSTIELHPPALDRSVGPSPLDRASLVVEGVGFEPT